MRRRKKILIAVISICVLSVWIIFFIRMHIVVKEPIEEVPCSRISETKRAVGNSSSVNLLLYISSSVVSGK